MKSGTFTDIPFEVYNGIKEQIVLPSLVCIQFEDILDVIFQLGSDFSRL